MRSARFRSTPPLLLICVDKRAESHPAFERARLFAVNILALGHEDLSRRFAVSGGDKFVDVAASIGRDRRADPRRSAWRGRVPRHRRRTTRGDHTIYIGRGRAPRSDRGRSAAVFSWQVPAVERRLRLASDGVFAGGKPAAAGVQTIDCAWSPQPPLGIVILAAGRGTRMRSERAKVLHAIAGKPFVVSVLETALGARARSRGGRRRPRGRRGRAGLRRHFARGARPRDRWRIRGRSSNAARATPSAPRPRPSTGSTATCSSCTATCPGFARRRCAALVEHHRATAAHAVAADDRPSTSPTGYGRILRDAGRPLRGIVEERDLDAARARHQRDQSRHLLRALAALSGRALARLRADNAQGEYYLTDIVAMAVDAGERVETRAGRRCRRGRRHQLTRGHGDAWKNVLAGHWSRNGCAPA